jgi:hypothetical protein
MLQLVAQKHKKFRYYKNLYSFLYDHHFIGTVRMQKKQEEKEGLCN